MATCTNCGASLPPDAQVCPRCTAPVPEPQVGELRAAKPALGRSRAERIAFGVLCILLAGLSVFLVLVFGFGMFVEQA